MRYSYLLVFNKIVYFYAMKENICAFESSILNILAKYGNLQVSAISEISGMSVPTTAKYLSSLLDKKLVRQAGKTNSERGRQAAIYTINGETAYFVGVDPKQTVISFAMMNLTGTIVREHDVQYEFSNTPETMELICESLESFIKDSGISRDRIAGISVNLSGRVNPKTGYSYSIFHFEEHDEPLSEVLSERLGIQTSIDNDTRAMALGELRASLGDRFKDCLFINASWGIGMSIIMDGRIYYGKDGYCGELGHTNVFDNEKMCHCGKKGCLETEVSGKALCEQLKKRISQGASSRLGKAEHITEHDIVCAANGEDPLSIELLERAGHLLGKQVANLINIFNPEAVIIGGSLVAAGDYFLQPIIQSVRRYALKLMFKNTLILPSVLGSKAGVLGACHEAREKYFDQMLVMHECA